MSKNDAVGVSEAWPVALTGVEPTSPVSRDKNLDLDIIPAPAGMSMLQDIFNQDAMERTVSGKQKLWVQTTRADFFFGGWIVVNAVVLALETDLRHMDSDSDQNDIIWVLLDSMFNVVFLIELLLRMYAERSKWPKDIWNIFDFFLVVVGVTDTWILPATGLNTDMRFVTLMRLFRLFRLIRVLRVLRLLRFLKELMLLVQGITSAMRAMVWGLLLLGITIFICALLITRLVGKACCEADDTFKETLYRDLFGSLPRTAFTLFQFTMEFQPDICRETWTYGPWLTIFFLAYTMFTNITLLNTVASVIVENILAIAQQNKDDEKAKLDLELEIQTKARFSQIFAMVDTDGNRTIDRTEISSSNPAVGRLLELSGMNLDQALSLFNVMDVDANGSVSRDEFQQALCHGARNLEANDVLKMQCQIDAMKRTVTSTLEDVGKQNTSILEALSRLEAHQRTLEDKIIAARQPDPRDLDNMSIPFVTKLCLPKPSANVVHAALPQDNAATRTARTRPMTAPSPWLAQERALPPGACRSPRTIPVALDWPRSIVDIHDSDQETLLV